MGLRVCLEKRSETPEHCVYVFGPPDARLGRVILYKDSGAIELAELASADDGPNERYYLAQVVPRLHTDHDQTTYPESDEWEA